MYKTVHWLKREGIRSKHTSSTLNLSRTGNSLYKDKHYEDAEICTAPWALWKEGIRQNTHPHLTLS